MVTATVEPGVTAVLVGVTVRPSLGRAATVTIAVVQVALTQPVVRFLARAKYVVLVVGETLGVAPPGTSVVPQSSVYQSTVAPSSTVADKVEDPPTQIAPGVAVGLSGTAGAAFTVTVVLAQVELPQEALSHRA